MQFFFSFALDCKDWVNAVFTIFASRANIIQRWNLPRGKYKQIWSNVVFTSYLHWFCSCCKSIFSCSERLKYKGQEGRDWIHVPNHVQCGYCLSFSSVHSTVSLSFASVSINSHNILTRRTVYMYRIQLYSGPGCSKMHALRPRVSAKFEFRFESLNLIISVTKLMTEN